MSCLSQMQQTQLLHSISSSIVIVMCGIRCMHFLKLLFSVSLNGNIPQGVRERSHLPLHQIQTVPWRTKTADALLVSFIISSKPVELPAVIFYRSTVTSCGWRAADLFLSLSPPFHIYGKTPGSTCVVMQCVVHCVLSQRNMAAALPTLSFKQWQALVRICVRGHMCVFPLSVEFSVLNLLFAMFKVSPLESVKLNSLFKLYTRVNIHSEAYVHSLILLVHLSVCSMFSPTRQGVHGNSQ